MTTDSEAPNLDGLIADISAKHAQADKLVSDLAAQVSAKTAELEQLLADSAAARTKTEAERDAATKAKEAALEAKGAAETERSQIKSVLDAATAAKTTLETERDVAIRASAAAGAAQTSAEDYRDKAAAANIAITSIKDLVGSEQEKILQLGVDVTAAKKVAESDRDKAAKACADTILAYTDADEHCNKAKERAQAATEEATKAAEAHNLSTTAGLAGAFNVKARENRGREILWGLALIGALTAAIVIGALRFDRVSELIATNPPIEALATELILSILGVGPAIWLAWMATRMISQNLAVTQDYAYKAALAQAYVGFREEAAGMDPLLEQRLFAAAITQLDANPVRLLGASHPGSPLQDLFQQQFMRDLLETNPTFKEKMTKWLGERFAPRGSVPKQGT
jgi:hypothetical protein